MLLGLLKDNTIQLGRIDPNTGSCYISDAVSISHPQVFRERLSRVSLLMAGDNDLSSNSLARSRPVRGVHEGALKLFYKLFPKVSNNKNGNLLLNNVHCIH